MKVATHELDLYGKQVFFDLMVPDTVSDFAVLRSIVAGALHKDPVDLPALTMDGPFLGYLKDGSLVRLAVTTSSFQWDRTPVNPEAIAAHALKTSLQSNAVVLFVVDGRAFSNETEARIAVGLPLRDEDEACGYCHRPFLDDLDTDLDE